MADTLIAGTTLVEKESRSVGDVPIGGVVAWLKNITGVPNLPEGWLLCDGSTVADALSPMNGQTIPDLNGLNKFLRGADTAGGTGGSDSHSHTNNDTDNDASLVNMDAAGAGNDVLTWPASIASPPNLTNAGSTLPAYHAVVWIIRIR